MIDVLSCLGSRGKVMLARGPMSGCPESRLRNGLTNEHGFDWSKRDWSSRLGQSEDSTCALDSRKPTIRRQPISGSLSLYPIQKMAR